MYQKGDQIIYSNYGVCRIEAIDTPDIDYIDKSKLYYTIISIYHNDRIFVPVDTNVFMRDIISEEDALELISSIPTIDTGMTGVNDIKTLESFYKECLLSHDCSALLKLIITIFIRERNAAEQGKFLGRIDDRYKKLAEDLLFGEFAIVLESTKENVKELIESKIPNA